MSRTKIVDDPEKRRTVRDWDASGLSAEEFGASRTIEPTTLRAWGRAIRGPLGRSRKRPVAREAELVEVAPVSAVIGERLEIVLKNGRRLSLAGDWTGERIAEIAATLEAT